MPLPYPILNTNKYKHKENYKKRFPKFSLLSSQSLWGWSGYSKQTII